jgi:hypothetical protein
VDILPEGEGLAIRVRDRGMGIPQREQRDIFLSPANCCVHRPT